MDNALTRLFTEINEKNQPKRPLTLTNVKPLAPVTVDDGENNTKLTIEAVPGRAYRNSVDIFYTRLSLPEILAGANIRNTATFTPQLVLDMVNSQFALFLTLDELEPFTVPSISLGQSATITLTSKVDSLGFLGSVEVEITNGQTLLEGVVGIRILPVLKHPTDPTSERLSSRMLTWGLDFTSLRDSLKINTATLSYTDWDTFSAAALEMGIPAWTKGTLTDHATADIPDSNPAFQRVTIQKDLNSANISGALYFHYNLLDGV